MATEEDKKKVGLNDVNFLSLGEDSQGEEEEVIVDDDEEVTQEQPEDEDQPVEQEDDDEIQEDETDDGDPPADEEGPEDEEIDEEQSEEDEQQQDEEDEDISIFQTAAEDIGVELEEEDLEGINTEDPTTADLSEFVDRMSDKKANRKYQDTIEEYPEVEGMLEFAKNGGDPRQYIETMHPQFDYNEVDFEEQVAGNEQAQEQLVRNHLQAQDTPEEEVDEMIEDFRNGGILEKQAKRSLNNLAKMQEYQQEQLVKQQEQAAEERRQEAQKQQQQIKSTIDESESIKGLKLPDTDKDDLKNYLFEPVNEQGQSKAFIDGQQMDEEERIAIAYLKMKGFDFETLIENEAESKNAKRIKDTIKNSKKEEVSSKKNKEKKTSGKVQDIKPII